MKIGLEVISCDDADYLSDLIQVEGYFFGLCPILKMNTNLIVSSGSEDMLPASLPLKDLILSSAGTLIYYIKFSLIDNEFSISFVERPLFMPRWFYRRLVLGRDKEQED